MRKNWKKLLTFALVLTMLIPAGSAVTVMADDTDAAAADTSADTDTSSGDSSSDDEGEEEDLVEKITDEEALKKCTQVAQNDKYILYFDDGEREDETEAETASSRFCLYVKETKKCWWSNPINAFADDTVIDQSKGTGMKTAQRKQVASNVMITYAELAQDKRTTKNVYSMSGSKEKYKEIDNGIEITFNFTKPKITVPVRYVLEDEGLRVSVDVSKIKEKNTSEENGTVLTNIALNPQFGAAPAADINGVPTEGYMIIPDGSGAVINYNNGKSGYSIAYDQKLYGRDYTAVPLSAPKVTDQAYLPVTATVSGKDGLVIIADEGDANADVCAQISGQQSQSYNTTYFSFELRSTDTYYMSGNAGNKLTVFEKGSIETPSVSVLYVPVTDEKSVNYADVAKVYRDHLIANGGLKQITQEGQYNFYLDLYGGVMKEQSILGIPVNLKTSMTSFEEAGEIIEKFTSEGVTDIVVGYNDWTNKLIKGNISTKFKPAGKLGGKGDFEDLESYAESVGAEIYPTVENLTMNSSTLGYWTFTNTAIRVSNAFSRQSTYSIAFGYEEKGVSPALLTPNAYGKVFGEILDSFTDKGQDKISYGDYSTALVSDFLKKEKSVRYKTRQTIVQGYEDATNGGINKILCDGANAYLFKYASHITDVPIYSSGFNITDFDIPFYQMVIHGYVPYSSTAINKSSDAQEAFLLSIAYGSGLHYDMIHEQAQEIADTDYDDLYYAYYDAWLDTAAKQNAVAAQALRDVSAMTISNFERKGNVLTTTYSAEGASDVTVVVDLDNVTVTVDGESLDMSDIKMTGGLLANE